MLCRCEQNWYGIDVMSSKDIAKKLNISQYAALKALHSLVKDGLVERGSMGCPAIFTGGEYDELVCEAKPPINGFRLTVKGKDTDVYRNEQTNYERSLSNWSGNLDE